MNDKRLDQTFQKKVNHVQKHNGIHVFWDKEGVWKRIQKVLEDTGGPKMVAWYTVMAASVSLLVASAVNIINYDLDLFNADQSEIVKGENEPLNLASSSISDASYYVSLPADSMIIPAKSRQVLSLKQDDNFSVLDRLPIRKSKIKKLTRLAPEKIHRSGFKSNLRFQAAGGLSVNSQFITPKIDLGMRINLSKLPEVKKSLFVGSSIQLFQRIDPEKGATRLSRGYFLKAAYENERTENGKRKSWSTGAEFLINSDDDSLPANTIRVFYNRSIHGRLKIGPEVLFTKDFKKIYPGITLAVG